MFQSQIKSTKQETKQDVERIKWAKFTYFSKETIFIKLIFKNTNVKVAFTTDNTIAKLLVTRHKHIYNTYGKCGIYQLTCHSCNIKYIGQTARPFKVHFRKQFWDFRYGNKKSKFAQHLLENRHPIGPMKSIMEMVHISNKG
jgi:hypothetical protein